MVYYYESRLNSNICIEPSFQLQKLDRMTSEVFEVKELTNDDQAARIKKTYATFFVVTHVSHRDML